MSKLYERFDDFTMLSRENSEAQADQRKKVKQVYAREGEAEFWDRAFCAALTGLLAPGREDSAAVFSLESKIMADQSCKDRRQARLQRWEEENG